MIRKYWGSDVAFNGSVVGSSSGKSSKFVDGFDGRFYYGRTVFEDGTVIPFMRPAENDIGSRPKWNGNAWVKPSSDVIKFQGDLTVPYHTLPPVTDA